MQHSKIAVLSVLLLCSGFSFAEWGSDDLLILQTINRNAARTSENTGGIYDIMLEQFSNGSLTIPDVPIIENIWYMRDHLREIAEDIYVIRNTQLSSIMSNVDASEGHLKYMRDNFTPKLDNLKLIATALSGQNSEYASINLGFDSIGKNVQKLAETSEGISNNVAHIRQNLSDVIYQADDGLNYLRIAPTAGDFSILTNFVLGSSYLSPWDMENGNDYYSLYYKYLAGEIDPSMYIAEWGIHNWLAGLNFGDWYVTAPDDADLEDSQGWGIVEEAKMEWSALAESTAFPPYKTSDARFWLYGTRYLTDYVGDILKFFNTNAVAQISDVFPEITDEIENPTTDDFPEDIQPEEPNEQQTQLEEILKTSEESSDPFDRFEYILNNLENNFQSIDQSSGNLSLHFNLNFLGVDQTVSVTIEQQARAKQAISTAIKFVCNGFKLASAVFIACAVAKTLTSRRFNVVMMYE